MPRSRKIDDILPVSCSKSLKDAVQVYRARHHKQFRSDAAAARDLLERGLAQVGIPVVSAQPLQANIA